MADARHDAVVIGGGHHGTIIACYLARAGLDVAVVERQPYLGGAAISEEGPAPGYRQNPCAHFTRFYAHPAYQDFDLRGEGLRYTFPEENEGIVFDDGSSLIGYSAYRVVDPETGRTEFAEDNVERTHEQIRQFSERDARIYLDVLDKYRRYWKKAFYEQRFAPPTPWGEPDPIEALLDVPDSGLEPVHQFMTVRQVAYDFFESPEMRTLFMRATPTSTGLFPDDVMGLQNLVHVMGLVLSFSPAAIAVGGTQAITDALVSAGTKLGVTYSTGREVDRIVVEEGRATGVGLSDGTELAAPLIVSDLGVPQTVLRLLPDDLIDERIRHRTEAICYDRAQILWGNVALHELPRYAAEADNPGIGALPRLYWGPKDPDYFATKYQHEIFLLGFPQRLHMLTAPDSVWDETRTRPGTHNVLIEDFSAPSRLFSPRDWERIRAEFIDVAFDQWRRVAPNMTKDNLVADRIYTPYDVLQGHPDMLEGGWSEGAMFASQMGRFRPFPEMSGYRTPVAGLYMCSSNLHSAGGIGRGSSYNCYRVIAEDLELPAP